MKKIEDLVFTVTKILSSAQTFEQMQFFYQLLKIDTWNTYGILFSVEQMTFFCRADDIFEKSVEQSRFEQMHFKQLTLTPIYFSVIISSLINAWILDSDTCLGLSICMNSFIVFSLIKVKHYLQNQKFSHT
jgi:hypothetical protein